MDLIQTLASSVIATMVSVRPDEPCFVDSVNSFPGVLDPSVSYNSLTPFSIGSQSSKQGKRSNGDLQFELSFL